MKQAQKINFEDIEFYIESDARLVFYEFISNTEQMFKNNKEYTIKWNSFKTSLKNHIKKEIITPDKVLTLEMLENIINSISNEFTISNSNSSRHFSNKLYRDQNSSVIGGVCSGISNLLSIDVSIIRLIFIIITFFPGFGIPIYIILWIIIPPESVNKNKSDQSGNKNTYNINSSSANHSNNNLLINLFKAIGNIIHAIFSSISSIIGLIILLFGVFLLFRIFHLWPLHHFPNFHINNHGFNVSEFLDEINPNKLMFLICIMFIILIPVFSIISNLIRGIFGIKYQNRKFGFFIFLVWFLCVLGAIGLYTSNNMNLPSQYKTESYTLDTFKSNVLYIDKSNLIYPGIIDNNDDHIFFKYGHIYNHGNKIMYGKPVINIIRTEAPELSRIIVKKYALTEKNHTYLQLDDIKYKWYQEDSLIVLDKYFYTENMSWWNFPSVKIDLIIPKFTDVLFKNSTPEHYNE